MKISKFQFMKDLFISKMLSLIRLRKNEKIKDCFLHSIETRAFVLADFQEQYMKTEGKRLVIIFSIFVSSIMLLDVIGVPFVYLIIVSQSMIFSPILTLFYLFGIARKIIMFFCSYGS